jgi:hypothetical protein
MPTTRLSEHFTLQEFEHSDTAKAHGFNNTAPPEAVANLRRLAEVMEEVREVLGGKPITITSGYRGPQTNAAVGGVPDSAHVHGRACDFVCPEFGTAHEVASALVPFITLLGLDQLIFEFDSWVHLGIAPLDMKPRGMALTIDGRGTRTGIADAGKPAYPVEPEKETAMNIGSAVAALKSGMKVAREGWNGKGMYLELQRPDAHSKMTLPYVYMKTADGHLVPWLCSQSDLLGEDWVVV